MNLVGERVEAEEQVRKGVAIREALAAEYPAVPVYREFLADSHRTLGGVLADQGKLPEAEEHFLKVLAIREKLVTDFPAIPRHRQTLSADHNSFGRLLARQGRQTEAEVQLRRGLAILERLAAESQTDPSSRSELARSHSSLGNVLKDLGKRSEAEEHYRKALAIKERLTTDFPDTPSHRVSLGGTCCSIGNLLLDNGKPNESLEWYGRSVRTLRPIHEKEPRDATARQFLQISYQGRARAYSRLGRLAEAVMDWDQVVNLCPNEERPQVRLTRAYAMLNAGRAADAAAEVAELQKLPGWPAGKHYDLARVYAIASGLVADKKAEYAAAAVALLRTAVKAGYTDGAFIERDTALDLLRGRADFRQLLLELGGPPARHEPAPPPRPASR